MILPIFAQTGWMETQLGKAVLIIGIPLVIGLGSDVIFEFIRRRRRAGSAPDQESEDAS